MAIITIQKNDLLNLVGKELSDEEISETLFMLKCETTFNDNDIECELNPDRPDMLSVEGVARAMKGFLGLETGIPKYAVGDSKFTLKNESEVRPFIACAIIRNITLSDELVRSLMLMQEKLHEGIGRKRKKVAIGVHNLDTIKHELVYKDVDPKKIMFVPLGSNTEMNLDEILESHPKGKDYGQLLKGFDKYPVIIDKDGVLSFPPIINSERTKVREDTKNLFIDVTGTDEKAVNQVLNIIVSNIAERSGKIESVKIGRNRTPDLEPKQHFIEIPYIDSVLGLGLEEKEIASILERMRYTVVKMKGGRLDVLIPPYRTDILHSIDIIEDVAIGYGYNNISPSMQSIASKGGLSEIESFSRKIRDLMIGLDFQEFMGMVLTNPEVNFEKMNSEKEETVELLNPTSSEYSICRTWLLPTLLKVLLANKHREYPQKIFEVGDCVLIRQGKAITVRKLCGVVSYDHANLTEMKSVVESILSNLNLKGQIKPFNHPSFIESRAGEIFVKNKTVGFFGEVHPKVLNIWGLEKPVVAFEIDLSDL